LILIYTNTSTPRRSSCSSPSTLRAAYFPAETEDDRNVPSGITMGPEPVAEPTTGWGAAGADRAQPGASQDTEQHQPRDVSPHRESFRCGAIRAVA
jgi:hypothetical protein